MRLPRRTARLRLTLLNECVSIVSAALRVGLIWLLVLIAHVGWSHASLVQILLVMSAVAIIVMAPVSMLLQWLIAGRVLRPLRQITTTTRGISATNLDRRLRLHGPDDELKELSDTIDALLDRLQASFESQGRFVANASHELRTPLARLKTVLQVALADPDPTLSSLRLAQQHALDAEQQLEQLIDALLALARGEVAEQREALDLAAVTERVIQTRAREIEHRRLRADLALNHARIRANPQLIERLVTNLLDNAITHNTPGGWLEVTTTTLSGSAVLTVANGGGRISPTDLKRIQQPFQRLTTDRTDHGNGHGLGLSIGAAIVNAHDGALKLDALPEGGLRVSVKLASPAQPPDEGLVPAAPPSQVSDRSNATTPTGPGGSTAT